MGADENQRISTRRRLEHCPPLHLGQTPDREVRQAERNTHQTNHEHLNRPSVTLHHKVQFQEDQKSVGSLTGEPDQQHREVGTSNKQAKQPKLAAERRALLINQRSWLNVGNNPYHAGNDGSAIPGIHDPVS